MFSILEKGQDVVNVDDLEALQNEIEGILVNIVTQKWQLERDMLAITAASPDNEAPSASKQPTEALQTTTSAPSTTTPSSEITAKLRHSTRPRNLDLSEQTSDGIQSADNESLSIAVIAEDSAGSEMSMASSQTGSTIIIAQTNLSDSNQGSQSNTSTKRSHSSADKPSSKRFRPNNSSSNAALGNSNATYSKRIHSKSRSKVASSKFQRYNEESRSNHVLASRSEAPDKLWPFVEQFCAAPTQQQILELEEMIEAIDNDKDYFKVPALGKNSPNNKSPPKASTSKEAGQSEASLGALTQRLVSCLIEETSKNESNNKEADDNGKKKNSKAGKSKKVDINSAKSLEKRVRQELEDHQILAHNDDISYNSEDDEVLRKLKSAQHELSQIQLWNKESMRQLAKRAKKHIELEAEREKLKDANSEVIGAYIKLIQAKQRKRNPTKKEKDSAWKALKVQDVIYSKCEQLYLSNLSRH